MGSKSNCLRENTNTEESVSVSNDPLSQNNDMEVHASTVEASVQNSHRANDQQEKGDPDPMKDVTTAHSESLQQELNNKDSDTDTKANHSETVSKDSTADTPVQSKDETKDSSSLDDAILLSEAKQQSNVTIQLKEDNHLFLEEITGYSGLVNQGSTCYLNAVLQTLFMTQAFRNAVIELKEKKNTVSFQLKKLFNRLKTKKGVATTNEVIKALAIRNVWEQQDAAEYYQKILSMTESQSAKIFQGKKKHSTTCVPNQHNYTEEICFFSLTITMESDQYEEINVQKGFDAQFEEMCMNGEDQLYCETCKTKTDMKMNYTILELPDILTLHLKRFYLDYNYMTYMKNNCPIEIPLQLSAQDESGVHVYELYAVVNHIGSLSGGHYYADIKSFEDQQWYRFDDSMVLKNLNDYGDRHFTSEMACLLFYRKSSEQNNHEANDQQEKGDLVSMKDVTTAHSESLQQELNNKDSDTDTKANHSETVSKDTTADTPVQLKDETKDSSSLDDAILLSEAKQQSNVTIQLKEDNHLFLEEITEQKNHRANDQQEKSDPDPMKDVTTAHSESLQQELNNKDSDTDTKANHSETVSKDSTADTPVQSKDETKDSSSLDDAILLSEAKQQSNVIIQLKEDNHLIAEEITASVQNRHRANDQQEKGDPDPMKDVTTAHSESLQQENNKDSDTDTKANHSETVSKVSTADTPVQSKDETKDSSSLDDAI